ncbi:hypothetical protein QAD02_015594 [Eretmocerus hayati]|uniref:Uncharacterized protein n=1 Tax=Eretmocerus hayati TaxID=131215 RepID=A0ACC2P930_9HYME|nr:hypothetical protein QAD02_015594 [Eretmocerus hayati]
MAVRFLRIFLFIAFSNTQMDFQTLPDYGTKKEQPHLLVTNRGEIWRIDESGQRKLCVNTTSVSDVDYHFRKNIIFWIDNEKSEIYGKAINATPSNVTIVFKQNRYWEPVALAVDTIDDKIYVADKSGMKIDIFALNGSLHSFILGSYLTRPLDIELDLQEHSLFILDGRKIIRTTTDGRILSTIVTKNVAALHGISLDPIEKRVSWFDSSESQLMSSSYTGTNLTYISLNNSFGFSKFLVYNKTVYYASDYIKYKSILEDEVSGLRRTNVRGNQPAPVIKLVYPQIQNSTSKPCEINNGGCQHMCLSKFSSDPKNLTHRCICHVGWELSQDSKNCTEVKEFLLYAEPGIIKTHSIQNYSEHFGEPYVPIRAVKLTDYDFDPMSRYLYYIVTHPLGNDLIYRTHLDDEEPELFLDGSLNSYQSLGFDHITSNLYITDTSDGTINVLNTKARSHVLTVLKNLQRPENIVVHPNKALLFFLQTRKNVTYLSKVNADGSNLVIFENNTLSKHCGFTVDFHEDYVYWFEWNNNRIQYSDFGLNEIRNISSNFTQYVYGIFIEQKWIYVVTSKSEGIWRLDKKTGKESELIVPDFTNRITKVKIFRNQMGKIDDNHPCIINNGGCEQICFGLLLSNSSWTKVCCMSSKSKD